MSKSLWIGMLCLTVLVLGSARTCFATGPGFSAVRVLPVGNDKLTVSGLDPTDSFTVDLVMNITTSTTEANGYIQLLPQTSHDAIWSGAGSATVTQLQTTINTKTEMKKYYASGIVYYQYQMHNVRGSNNTTTEAGGAINNYTLP